MTRATREINQGNLREIWGSKKLLFFLELSYLVIADEE
jgi:hypothetical protein